MKLLKSAGLPPGTYSLKLKPIKYIEIVIINNKILMFEN